MAVNIHNDQDKVRIPAALPPLLQEIAEHLLQEEGRSLEEEITLILVDDGQIWELNRTYRKLDRITDVLAFDLQDEMTGKEEDRILGDVVISVERAAAQAQEYGHSLEREIAFLAVHGILHLLGYDHSSAAEEKEMFSRQHFILKKFHFER